MELGDIDPDIIVRHEALSCAMWLADSVGGIDCLDDLLSLAMRIEFYLTDGASVQFDCQDSSRKFVRGQ